MSPTSPANAGTPASALPAGYTTGTWQVDAARSTVGFAVRHLIMSTVRGRFGAVTGTIVTAPDPLASSATATIDLSSVTTGNAQRDAWLRAADFFEGGSMAFTSTAITRGGKGYAVTGDLTLNGFTRPVTFQLALTGFASDADGTTRAGFVGTGSINRRDWGVSFRGLLETGGAVVADKVDLTLEVVAVQLA